MTPHRRIRLAAVLAAATFSASISAQVQEAWIDRLDGPASMSDYGEAIAVAADGSTYVAGLVFQQVQPSLFSPRFMTIRYDATGSRLWTRTYAGTFASGAAAAKHVAVDPNGDIVVAGSTNQGDDWAVVKYDPSGTELWRSVYEADSTFLTEPADMALDGSGNVYLAGYVGDSLNPDAGAIVKFTPAGDEAWARRYYGPTFDSALFNAVAVDDLGHVYAAGAAYVPGRASEMIIVQYDDAGTKQWHAVDGSIGQSAHDRATELAVDGSGDIIAVGLFGSNTVAGTDVVVAKVDPAGTILWRQLYNGPAGRHDAATAVAVDGNNEIVVVGYSGTAAFDDYDALTLKFGTSGALAWDRRVSGDEVHFDWASAVALDAQDNVYVTGAYDPIGGSRFFTASYGSNGAERWFKDYAGPMGGGSGANAIAVGPDGSVSVTGDSPGAGTSFDITTIRYEQPAETVPGDVDGDAVVGFDDLLVLLSAWGPCGDCPDCPADLDGDCAVGLSDLITLLSNWS